MKRAMLAWFARRDLPQRTAAVTSAFALGSSFSPGLLPRGPTDQAVATGLSAGITYGIASITESFIEGVARRVLPGERSGRVQRRRYLKAAAHLGAAGAGVALQRAFVQRRGEPIKRALVRTAGYELTVGGAVGLGVTIVVGSAAAVDRRRGPSSYLSGLPISVTFGACASAYEIAWYRRRQHNPPPLTSSMAEGLAVMAGVSGLALSENALAHALASAVRRHVPGLSLLAEPIGHSVGLGVLFLGIGGAFDYLVRTTEHGGAAIEAAYATVPTAAHVSGGPKSHVAWDTLGREGRRFVNMALTSEEIGAVTGRSAVEPVRVFVGLGSDPNLDRRVAMCLQDLEVLGAFSRSVLCFASPTGTGYVNYVMAETLEYLTGGDCATVAMQYSLRPSFLSLDRVRVGREQNRALLHAVSGRLLGMEPDQRPKLVGFGESLGAFTLQDAFLHEGTGGFARAGLARALFIGTPAESKWAEQWRSDPDRWDPSGEVVEVASHAEWSDLDEDRRRRTRYVLLSHHEDPITKFTPGLAVQAPEWMSSGPGRSPAVAPGVRWHPFTTAILTAVDLKNASHMVPGKFAALGHDYRADLARFTALAFDLAADEHELVAVEEALRTRELHWAEQRLVADQLAQAREAVARTLRSWGTDGAVGVPSSGDQYT